MPKPVNTLFDLEGKVALVTGGAQGLGRMIAAGLATAGATVYITSRKAEVAERSARELSTIGPCHGLTANLATPEAAVALATGLARREPRLDILVNNAGKTWGAPLESFPDRAWPDIMAVNVQGPFTLIRELLPLLKASGTPDDPHHLSRVLAADLAPYHIAVNNVVPGFFPTQMTAHIREDHEAHQKVIARVPLQRLGRADDIAGACVFLASRAASYITGTDLPVDGGLAGCR